MRTDILSKLEELLQQEDAISNAREFKSLRKEFEIASTREKESKELESKETTDTPLLENPGQSTQEGILEKTNEVTASEPENAEVSSTEVSSGISPIETAVAEEVKKDTVEDHEDDDEDHNEEHHDEGYVQDEVWEKYKTIVSEFNQKFSAALQKKKEEEAANLKIRKSLLAELKDLIENEENIGKAFAGFNEIQEKWKNAGSVSNEDYRELNTEYNRFVELFFYNINIYKELKEYDLKHNLELKKEILEKQKNLVNETSIKKIEKEVRENQDKWNSIGPTFKEEWETIKDEFWTYTRECYKKVQEYYDEKRSHQADHLEAKKVLLDEAKKIDFTELKSHKKWQEKSNEIIELQNQWKKSGFVPKEQSAEVWKAFRQVCDSFFEAKRAFYEDIRKIQDGNKQAKETLVQQAESLQENIDWRETSNVLIQLQKDWKKIGNAHQRDENKLWKRFRSACDAFFERKKEHFAGADSEQKENLESKTALIAEVKEFEPSGDKITDLESFKSFSDRWRKIGFVPFKEKDRIHNEFTEAINSKYNALNIDRKEKQKIIFEEKLENIKDADDSEKLLGRERSFIRNKIDKIKAEIIQLENNLGFFANSKGANEMKKSVEQKIDKLKKETVELREQLKLVNNAQ